MGATLMFTNFASRACRLGAIAAVGVASILSPAAHGQPGGAGRGGPQGGGMRGMMGDLFSSPVTNREIDLFTQVAGLTTDQKEAAKTILEGYQENFRSRSNRVQRDMDRVREKFQETRDPGVWLELRTTMQDFRAQRTQMEEQFFSDFKSLLTPQQVERWPAIERAHRRSRTLGRGMISGERADLIQIMESSAFPVDVQATVLPVLGDYEEALDRALIARNKAYDEVADAFQQGGMGDGFARAQELFAKGREASIRVRELNRRYARQILDMLPETSKEAFDSAFKRASYPDVYRPTSAGRQISAAEQFTDLDDTQKESLSAVKTTYARSLAAINEKMAAAITRREEEFDPRQMMQRMGRGGRGGGQGDNDQTAELRREKRALDETTAANLRKILREDQVGRLPQEGDDEAGDRRRGGGGGGGERRRGQEI
ncbi:MAG: hypothetical protein KF787_09970 [Phycisphaeraceae bacterium]|nr:hypothetical protein [Phycisphaerae bacterium]MBX3392960.1 hypothetical protein [Phycisphaeraceae bacterium]